MIAHSRLDPEHRGWQLIPTPTGGVNRLHLMSGVVVRPRGRRWEVVTGPLDGGRYHTLGQAVTAVERGVEAL